MRATQTLRFLSLPAAVALGTALALACSTGAPTAIDESELGPSFAPKKPGEKNPHKDAIGSTYDCGAGFTLTSVKPGSGVDDNEDGWVCKATK